MAQLTESERTAGIAMSFPANDEDASCSTSTPKIPRRLRKRLLEQKTPTTAEEIDAKLKEAGIRRQVCISIYVYTRFLCMLCL